MKCDKFQAIAGQLARNEIMDAHERDKALSHPDTCKRCQELLAAQDQLSDSLRLLAEETRVAYSAPGLEDRVLAAFRAQTNTVSVSDSSGSRRYWAVAAAAVVLLAVGVAAWRWHVASAIRQAQQASARETSLPVSDPNREALTAAPMNETPSPNSLVTPRRLRPRRQSKTQVDQPNVVRRSGPSVVPSPAPETREVVTQFVSLGYGSVLDLQDGAQMVRVELPRSALVRFGLPMNMDRADERIKADVLIGADGLARAIRFVQRSGQLIGDLKPGNERN